MGLMGKLGKLYRGEHRTFSHRPASTLTHGMGLQKLHRDHRTTCSRLLLMMGCVALAFCGRCTKTAMTRRAIALGKRGGLIGSCVFQSVGMVCSVLAT